MVIGGYLPRCPDFDDVACGFTRTGIDPPFFPFAGRIEPGAPISFGREDFGEKSGMPRGDFFFMEIPRF